MALARAENAFKLASGYGAPDDISSAAKAIPAPYKPGRAAPPPSHSEPVVGLHPETAVVPPTSNPMISGNAAGAYPRQCTTALIPSAALGLVVRALTSHSSSLRSSLVVGPLGGSLPTKLYRIARSAAAPFMPRNPHAPYFPALVSHCAS
eukprot:3517756-Prymnesium_polylepis.1